MSGGLAAIQALFTRVKAEGRTAFLPYFPIGYPNYEDSLAAIEGIAGRESMLLRSAYPSAIRWRMGRQSRRRLRWR